MEVFKTILLFFCVTSWAYIISFFGILVFKIIGRFVLNQEVSFEITDKTKLFILLATSIIIYYNLLF